MTDKTFTFTKRVEVPFDPVIENLWKQSDLLRQIVASADKRDRSTGAGVPLVSIDARLIDRAKELLNLPAATTPSFERLT